MAKNRAASFARLVALVNHIERNPGVSVENLAKHFDRSPAQVRNDISLLDQAGFDDLLPGRTLEIDMELYVNEGRVQLRDSLGLQAAMLLTAEDLARLLFGLEALGPGLLESERAAAPVVASKLAALLGPEEELALAKLETTALDADRETLQALDQALQLSMAVRFTYVRSDGSRSDRKVIPTSVSLERDGWVLLGRCVASKTAKRFRLDRMSRVKLVTRAEAEVPPSLDPTHQPLPQSTDGVSQVVEVKLDEGAEWLVGETVADSYAPTPSGWKADYTVWDPQWMRTELILLAPHVEGTDPKEFGADAAMYASEAAGVWEQLRAWSQGGRGGETGERK